VSKEIDELIKAAVATYKRRVYTINILNPPAPVIRGKREKPVITPLGEFNTRRAAAAAHGVHDGTMYAWILRKKEGFFYKENDNEEN